MIAFAKAHAYGNDFLYVASADVRGAALDVLAREMCDRHTGVGADGLIVYERVDAGAAMRLFNADGSRAEVSGNGVRALGALLLDKETGASAELTVRTEGGVKRLTRIGRDGSRQTFRASMGAPADIRQIRHHAPQCGLACWARHHSVSIVAIWKIVHKKSYAWVEE